ncbi:MAG: HupE/UreJ family protein, partial [Gammaproteobacteria bacterium]|nr:HupE/UreJ family protein [Gammaproteobacteria bacterium]
MQTSVCGLLVALLALWTGPAVGHELKPAFLRIDATSDTDYAVVWKRPFGTGGPLSLRPVLPAGCAAMPGGIDFVQGTSLVRRDVVRCTEGMDGKTVGIEGNAVAMADVMVQVTLRDGRQINGVIGRNRQELSLTGGGAPVADYVVIGVEHLLLGADHLLFLLCLLYLLGTQRLGPLVQTVTAFTVAHSITLALSALDVVVLPVAPVEATVALSIAFVAAEKLRGTEGTIASEHVWIVAFLFGLLHGFGFAGALAE